MTWLMEKLSLLRTAWLVELHSFLMKTLGWEQPNYSPVLNEYAQMFNFRPYVLFYCIEIHCAYKVNSIKTEYAQTKLEFILQFL